MKTKSLPFIISKLFWYPFLSESKIYVVTLSAPSLIVISMLSVFECIKCSSSLSVEEIELFAIINWIFHELLFWDYLWFLSKLWSNFIKIFFIWLRFISVTFTFTFNIIITQKNTHSYWFIIIFFVLKNNFFLNKKL